MKKKYNKLTKLQSGEILLFPTDTLFALSCDAYNETALNRLFAMKKRNIKKSFPIFIHDIKMIDKIVDINELANNLIQKYWPGQLTLILPLKHGVILSNHICNLGTIAVRIPNSPDLLSLIAAFGNPITATSANLSGEGNLSSIAMIKQIFPNIYIDDDIDNYMQHNISHQHSTIVSCVSNKPQILRLGIITTDEINSCRPCD